MKLFSLNDKNGMKNSDVINNIVFNIISIISSTLNFYVQDLK